jgi:hypothetical protein
MGDRLVTLWTAAALIAAAVIAIGAPLITVSIALAGSGGGHSSGATHDSLPGGPNATSQRLGAV